MVHVFKKSLNFSHYYQENILCWDRLAQHIKKNDGWRFKKKLAPKEHETHGKGCSCTWLQSPQKTGGHLGIPNDRCVNNSHLYISHTDDRALVPRVNSLSLLGGVILGKPPWETGGQTSSWESGLLFRAWEGLTDFLLLRSKPTSFRAVNAIQRPIRRVGGAWSQAASLNAVSVP